MKKILILSASVVMSNALACCFEGDAFKFLLSQQISLSSKPLRPLIHSSYSSTQSGTPLIIAKKTSSNPLKKHIITRPIPSRDTPIEEDEQRKRNEKNFILWGKTYQPRS